MKLGFVILAHNELHRVAELAEHLVGQNCCVALHVDRRAPVAEYERLLERLARYPEIVFTKRVFSEWGSFSLVQASLNASEDLLETFPTVEHIALISGSCLPIRPIKQMQNFLSRHKFTDFIESVSVETERWVKGGLNEERFTLFFPFSWRRRRKMFDMSVNWQRRLKITRKIPQTLKPHIGSQWWCLTRTTLSAIINDKDRDSNDRYFAKTWIPDESYFQTLARVHGERIESRSLTFSRFDSQGKPFTLYDDHLDLMRKTDCFFMRKVWPKSDRLYKELLSPKNKNVPFSKADPRAVETYFDAKIVGRMSGGHGHYSPGRFPMGAAKKLSPTSVPYSVFIGFQEVFDDFPAWLSQETNSIAHGNLFGRRSVEFANGQKNYVGNQTANIKIRNENPYSFISNVIWNSRDQSQSFLFNPEDHTRIQKVLVSDRHSKLNIVKGAWLLRLHSNRVAGDDMLKSALYLQQAEKKFITKAHAAGSQCQVSVIELQDVIDQPTLAMKLALESVGSAPRPVLGATPILRDFSPLEGLVRSLRNKGMDVPTVRVAKRKTDAEAPVYTKPKLIS